LEDGVVEANSREGGMKILALLLGFALLPVAAFGQFSNLPPNIQAAIQESEKSCDEGHLTFKPKFVERRDVNGDGIRDYILNYGETECGGSAMHFCGTGGCSTQVFASLDDGSFVMVLDENVRGLQFRRLSGRPAMIVDVHGAACGRVGAESCRKTLYWNGVEFSPAN
jgi:hypothetical protein